MARISWKYCKLCGRPTWQNEDFCLKCGRSSKKEILRLKADNSLIRKYS